MKKHEYKEDVSMSFTDGKDWHHDIFLPLDAQMNAISLRVYSPVFTDYLYNISWSLIRMNGAEMQIPIDAARLGLSDSSEGVRIAIDITYFTEKRK